MASQLVFRYRDDEPWPVVKDAFDIIKPYLQLNSDLSATETATRLDTLTPSKRSLAVGELREKSASFLLEFWEVFVEIAKQLPYDDPSQNRLVELLQQLNLLQTPDSTVSNLPYVNKHFSYNNPILKLTPLSTASLTHVERPAMFGYRAARTIGR